MIPDYTQTTGLNTERQKEPEVDPQELHVDPVNEFAMVQLKT